MAYGAYTTSVWKNVFTNTGYILQVSTSYCQDPVANKTKVRVDGIHLVSKNGYYVNSHGNTKIGYGSHSSELIEVFNLDTVMSSSGDDVAYWKGESIYEYIHDSNGNAPEIFLYAMWYISGKPSPGLPPNEYNRVNLTVPKIDRNAPVASVSLVSTSVNSILLKLTTNCQSKKFRIRIDGGNWNDIDCSNTDVDKTNGGTIIHELLDLKSDTIYLVEIQFLRNWNGIWSNIVNIVATTLNDQAKAWIISKNELKKGKIWINKNGVNFKSKTAYINVDGILKRNV